jgi:hypothetical protein
LGKLVNVWRLQLTNNQLTDIPPELSDMSGLLYLHLENNQLTSIPPELGNLTELETLHLENNELTGLIPARLSDLSRLHTLDLSNNPNLVCWQTQAALDWALGLGAYHGPQDACPFMCLPMVVSAGD